ncbi:MAG: o-succinylbenzoate synthase [Flavobacteriales bacterium]|nr:o-succinylbenzoate synthase [Flavobacteriales bacterium]
MTEKTSWIIEVSHQGQDYYGECGLLAGLSIDDREGYRSVLAESLVAFENDALDLGSLHDWPSIRCGWEMLLNCLENEDPSMVYSSEFRKGRPIPINGLIWMADAASMQSQIEARLEDGFDCIKMKIGAIDVEKELALLKSLRKRFDSSQIEIRVDANGAFSPKEAAELLPRLADLEIHSIEQPIARGQWDEMARLCQEGVLPIALDEELIGITDPTHQARMVQHISPQYLILKPSLIGGFQVADRWIELAESIDAGWWATSALESNIGLNAIAQWCGTKDLVLPQGLGTGSLYLNNIPSPLSVKHGQIAYDRSQVWDYSPLHDR